MVMFLMVKKRDQPIRKSRHGRATQQVHIHRPRIEQKLTVFDNLPDIFTPILTIKVFRISLHLLINLL